MKILMITDVCWPRVNGVATSIETFRRSLHELGHETLLVGPAYPSQEPSFNHLIRVPSRPAPRSTEDRLMHWGRVLKLESLLARRQFDVLHVHTPFVAHYAGVKLARRLGIPVVETYHTFFEEYVPHYVPSALVGPGRWLARRLTVSQCADVDALVVPSPQMLARLQQHGIDVRSEVLPTGIDVPSFVGGDGSAFRLRHGIDAARPVLVHISRIAHEKNIDFILRMLAELRRAVPDVLLVIAGEGPAVAHVRNLATGLGLAGNVLFVGYLERATELLDCYRAGDAFVFASRTETQGLVLLEALALGVPVVSTAVMGTADVLRGAGGALVAPEDERAFAALVASVLRDPMLRRRLSESGPADAARWSAQALAGRLAALYAEVVARHRRDAVPGPVARADAGLVIDPSQSRDTIG
jgi:glycosyltransferase involved in cell wall biosynthesis